MKYTIFIETNRPSNANEIKTHLDEVLRKSESSLLRDVVSNSIIVEMDEDRLEQVSSEVIDWVAFDFMQIDTRPKEYGRYLICRKDGKIHWETWNGSGWAYNHNEIRFWAVITSPKM